MVIVTPTLGETVWIKSGDSPTITVRRLAMKLQMHIDIVTTDRIDTNKECMWVDALDVILGSLLVVLLS